MNDAYYDAKEMIIEYLENEPYGMVCDMHHEIFNTDYFIIGTYKAKEYLENNIGVFDAIEKVQDYEKMNFGEYYTKISEPEKLLNMYIYIVGEEVLNDYSSVSYYWNENLDSIISDDEDEENDSQTVAQAILEELQ